MAKRISDVMEQVAEDIPIYHTRAMIKDFLDAGKILQGDALKPHILKALYNKLTGNP